MCLCRHNLTRPCYWNCRSGVFVQPCYSPLAAGQWNILPSVEFPHHDGIIEMCQEALCLGSLAPSHTVRQPHIKVSSHTHAQTHKATTWKVLPDPENPKVLCCCVSTHKLKHRQIHLYTLTHLHAIAFLHR